MTNVARFEETVARFARRRHCIGVGRGATAIYLVLQAFRERDAARSTVVLPATLCTSPAAVTQLAGLTPVFCDVEPDTGNMDPAALAALLARDGRALCVMAAHLFGQPAKLGDLAEVCRAAGVPLIEDAAQALGATVEGRPAGAGGDAAVFSFGHTKILDAGGGGAILTDDDNLAMRLRRLAAALPPRPAETATWGAQYRRAYYALAPAMAEHPRLKRLVGRLCELYPRMFTYALDDATASRAAALLDTLPEEIDRRRSAAARYEALFAGSHVRPLTTSPGGVPWRFGLLAPADRRDEVLAALRSDGIDASAWYPLLPPQFTEVADRGSAWPNAVRLDRGIVNLWVDRSVTGERIERTCRLIGSVLAGGHTSESNPTAPKLADVR